MLRGLAAIGLIGLSCAALAQAPSRPPLAQNEEGACVSAGVQDRFREPRSAEGLAREIVAGCIPERRGSGGSDPRRKAYFDQRYADDRASALAMSTLRIERFRRNAAAAASIPNGEPTLTVPVAELILRMARQNWREPIRNSEIRLQRRAVERPIPGSEWRRRAAERVEVESGSGRFATYYVDSLGRVVGLFINSGPAPECRPFGARETLAVEAALMAVPAATAKEIQRIRASVRAGWTSGNFRIPARVGSYTFLASRVGGSGPGRVGCHDHFSLTFTAAG